MTRAICLFVFALAVAACGGRDHCYGNGRDAAVVIDPHPAGWANNRASGNFHGDAVAAKGISSCWACGCHDQGTAATCYGCHRLGGIAPPPSW